MENENKKPNKTSVETKKTTTKKPNTTKATGTKSAAKKTNATKSTNAVKAPAKKASPKKATGTTKKATTSSNATKSTKAKTTTKTTPKKTTTGVKKTTTKTVIAPKKATQKKETPKVVAPKVEEVKKIEVVEEITVEIEPVIQEEMVVEKVESMTPKAETKKEVKSVENLLNREKMMTLVVSILLIIFLSIYLFQIRKDNEEKKINTSYLVTNNLVAKELTLVNDLKNLNPTKSYYFVFINYQGDKANYDLETGIKDIINKYRIKDSFYYLNVTSTKDDSNLIGKINESLGVNIRNVPALLYFNEDGLVDYVRRDDDNMIEAGDFQKMLDIWEFKAN